MNVYTLEGYTEQILRAFDHIAIMVWSDENKSCLILDKIHEFFYHLMGQEKEVTIKEQDINDLELAIKTIGIVGRFSADFNKSVEIIKSVYHQLLQSQKLWTKFISGFNLRIKEIV